jgi:pyroglutamyl-peptidase
MKQKILVTGFKPFLGESLNPSELVLAEIQSAQIETLVLPVSYRKSFPILKEHWRKHGPYTHLLMLGQAGGRKAIGLERIAINWSECSNADEEGFLFPTGPLIPNTTSSYISKFFPTAWKDNLAKTAPVEISHSAGTYVCNSLYFHALHELPKTTPILFVHLPYLPEQIKDKTETAAMDLQTQTKIIQQLIELLKTT